jgi:hypothetical protein
MSLRNDVRAIVHVPCPRCGAPPGMRCRALTLWATPREQQPTRPHAERRQAEQARRQPGANHHQAREHNAG